MSVASAHTIGGAVALLLLVPSRSTAAERVVSPDEMSRDPRLQRSLEAKVLGRSLEATLGKLSEAAGVPLESDRAAGDQKIILATARPRVGEVLREIAEHFQLLWKREAPSPQSPVSVASYRLIQDGARLTLAADLRRRAVMQREVLLRSRLDLRIRALDAPLEELEKLVPQDPFIRDLALHSFLRARTALAAQLTPSDREALFSGKPYVSAPLRDLPPQLRELVSSAAQLRPEDSPEPGKLRYVLSRTSHEGSDQLWFSLIDPDTHEQIGSGGGLVPQQSARRDAGGPVPARATDKVNDRRDPDLQREVSLLDQNRRGIEITAGLQVVLDALARASGYNVLSDYYSDLRTRFNPSPLGQRPLWQHLNIIAEQYNLEWELRGTWLLFRSRYWYEEEEAESPERLLAPWRSQRSDTGRVSPAEFLQVLSTLSTPQIEALPRRFPGVAPYYQPLWPVLLGSLDSKQRQTLLRGRDLYYHNLTPRQQQILPVLLPGLKRVQYATAGVSRAHIRLQPAGDSISNHLTGHVIFGTEVQRYRLELPLKQPPLEPPSVRLYPPRQ
jgi:hypothetical protein